MKLDTLPRIVTRRLIRPIHLDLEYTQYGKEAICYNFQELYFRDQLRPQLSNVKASLDLQPRNHRGSSSLLIAHANFSHFLSPASNR